MEFEEALEKKKESCFYCFTAISSWAHISWDKWEILLMHTASVLKAEFRLGGET